MFPVQNDRIIELQFMVVMRGDSDRKMIGGGDRQNIELYQSVLGLSDVL